MSGEKTYHHDLLVLIDVNLCGGGGTKYSKC